MEVYILDSFYRRVGIVDMFESLIWSERWADIGDFELLVSSTPVNRSLFTPRTLLALNQSKRVMVVETIEDNTDAEGRTRLKVKGRSIEKILQDRIARRSKSDTETEPTWIIVGQPYTVATTMLNASLAAGAIDAGDVLPLLFEGTSYPAESIPMPVESIIWEQKPAPLYDALKDLCTTYEMGFRLYRDGDNKRLYFDFYTGNDRTTSQKALSSVIFTPGFETVQNTTRFMNISEEKNVAYVYNEQGFEIVYAKNVRTDVLGFERRVLHVNPPKLIIKDADNQEIQPTAAQVSAWLIAAGKEELIKHRALLAFDGELNQHSPYVYGIHYQLGDLVEMRDDDGVGNKMRVTEQIFVSDASGDRAYPTLTIDSFIVPGAWNSWIGNREWADFGATEYWNTQP